MQIIESKTKLYVRALLGVEEHEGQSWYKVITSTGNVSYALVSEVVLVKETSPVFLKA